MGKLYFKYGAMGSSKTAQALIIAKHSETEEEMVVYRALYGEQGEFLINGMSPEGYNNLKQALQ